MRWGDRRQRRSMFRQPLIPGSDAQHDAPRRLVTERPGDEADLFGLAQPLLCGQQVRHAEASN